jgi:hypothetical protein
MAFNREAVATLLTQCHRRCCICHRFCGVKMETDHIQPVEQGGSDEIDNAIPVYFECHAEIHSYNDKHPRGRKFTPDELRAHKEQWLAICRERPEIFVTASWETDVGPLQALIDELDFNQTVAAGEDEGKMGCLFQQAQFLRAIKHGAIAILKDEVRVAVLEAYREMGTANTAIEGTWQQAIGNAMVHAHSAARKRVNEAKPKIATARQQLLHFLGHAA